VILSATDYEFVQNLLLERAAIRISTEQEYLVRSRLEPVAKQAGLSDLRALVEQLLEPHGLAPADVAHWAVHPGGPEILEQVQRRLRLSDAQLAPSREVLADGGNRSSATVLFILESMLGSGDLRPGQWLVTLGFGTGLTLEALLLRA